MKGYAAILKFADAAKVSEDEARKWLEKQALWQIHLPATKYIPRPHWRVDKPKQNSPTGYTIFTMTHIERKRINMH